MKAIPIDDFIEALEEGRQPETPPLGRHQAGDWGRVVEEARAARTAADGGRWRIGQLAGLVEKRYGSASLQRFSEEIGESYATVRRYRWVASRFDARSRFRFPSLSFSHFQSVARLPDRLAWLDKAERGGWSVDRLTRAAQTAGGAGAAGSAGSAGSAGDDADARLNAAIDAMRRHLTALGSIDQRSLTATCRERVATALSELAAEIRGLQKRLGISPSSRAAHRAASRRAPVRSVR